MIVGALAVSIYLNTMLDLVHYVPALGDNSPAASGGDVVPMGTPGEDLTTASDSPKEQVSSIEDQLKKNLEDQSTPLMNDKNVLNILLIGSDNRADVGGSRSDSMIIVSINKNTKQLIMTSLLRDIYLSIPGHGNDRLNAAYAYGGADLLIQTIQDNFKIEIDRYVSVDFMAFVDIIDQLGGVTVTVTAAELPYVNDSVREINSLENLPENDGVLGSAGDNLLLTGKQALGYARIRHIGDDFGRTQRQRTVLSQVFAQVKDENLFELNQTMTTLLPYITTNFTKGELVSLLLDMVSVSKYPVVQETIPIDGSWNNLVIRSMAVLGINFKTNINQMQQTIYGGP